MYHDARPVRNVMNPFAVPVTWKERGLHQRTKIHIAEILPVNSNPFSFGERIIHRGSIVNLTY